MSDVEEAILRELKELDEDIRRMATAEPKPNLKDRFARIDALAGQLPPGADPNLRHFLDRKSYEKARLHLEGQRAARGSCGR